MPLGNALDKEAKVIFGFVRMKVNAARTKNVLKANKNTATAAVTGLKPNQKVKVTVNVRLKP
jgi:hypothetical protein